MKKAISHIFQRIIDRSSATAISIEQWRTAWPSPDALWAKAMTITFPADDSWPRKQMQLSEIEIGRGGQSHKEMQSPGEFSGLRAYQPGDEPRYIDWRATARLRQPIVRQWSAESKAGVAILVDVSASMYVDINSTGQRPIDKAFDIALLLSAAALARQIPVQLVLASDHEEWHSGKLVGRDKIQGLFEFLLEFQPSARNTGWSQIEFQSVLPEHGQWLFLMSDFLWLPDPMEFSARVSSYQTHGIHLISNLKKQNSGDVWADPETGEKHSVHFKQIQLAKRLADWQKLAGIPILLLENALPEPEIALSEWLRGDSFDDQVNLNHA